MHPNLNKSIIRIPLLGVNNLDKIRLSELSTSLILQRLRILCTHQVLEALYISSPEFAKTVQNITGDIDENKIEIPKLLEVWLTFVKYYTRMCSRGTPYGLMASVGVIGLGKETFAQKEFPGTIHAQLDNGIVSKLSHALEQSDELRASLLNFPNPSIYRHGNKLKYIEAIKIDGAKEFALSKIETNLVIETVLSYSVTGKKFADLSSFIQREFKGIYERDEIEQLLYDLIENQILLSSYSSSLTKETLFSHLAKTSGVSKQLALQSKQLCRIKDNLNRIGKPDWTKNKPIYLEIEADLERLNINKDSTSTFHLNFIRSFSNSSINSRISEKIREVAQLLAGINDSYRSETLEAFKSAFLQRYEHRFVALTEVLDEEIGLGFPVGNIRNKNADGAFDGINLPTLTPSSREESNFNSFYLYLFKRVSRLKTDGTEHLEFTASDLQKFSTNKAKLPPTYSIYCTLLGASGEDIDGGNFKVAISNGASTSASSPISRFSVSDKEIEELCEEIFDHEKSIFHDKIVAEVLHSPNPRVENITFRAVSREYEIPLESLSSHQPSNQIKLDDIWITVVEDEVKLFSKKYKKEIVPRISNSHPFNNPHSLPAYHLLGELQLQGQQNFFLWRWGPLSKLDFLPRVVIDGRIICSLATWRIQLEKDFFLQTENATEQLKLKLKSLGLPKYVSLRQNGDNLLVIDVDDQSCLLILVREFKKNSHQVFHEYLANADNSFIKDYRGNSYVNELIVPYLGEASNFEHDNGLHHSRRKLEFKQKRSFFPGEDFLYLKIYCTKNVGQLIVTKYLAPIFLHSENAPDQVFFLRYEDPDYHIRLRIRTKDNNTLIPLIFQSLSKLISQKLIHKIQYDTYNRELDRYSLIPYEKTETIFSVDSKAIVHTLAYLERNGTQPVTWIIAIKNIHSYLSCFGMNIDEMLAFCLAVRNGFFAELNLNINKDFLKSLNAKGKKNYLLIESVLSETNTEQKRIYTIFKSRENNFKQILTSSEMKKIRGNVAQFSSYIHMSINRLFASDQRVKEAISYDLLYNFLLTQRKITSTVHVKQMRDGSDVKY